MDEPILLVKFLECVVFDVAIAAVAICYQNVLFIHIVINCLPTNLLDT